MRIQFWSVGKAHENYIKPGVEDFTNRLQKYFPVEWLIIPPPKNSAALPEAEQKKKESEALLALIKKDDYLVALDERGKQFTSEHLASFIQGRANESVKRMIFLIGGAYGIDDVLLKKANYKWSLSQLTFPHQLVRLILAEQVYRACSILRNEKYHHK